MICKNCGEFIPDEDKFCTHCGCLAVFDKEAASLVCSSCGELLVAGDKFCIHCGKPIGRSAESESAELRCCENCGSPLDDGLKFCTQCGALVRKEPDHVSVSPQKGSAQLPVVEDKVPVQQQKKKTGLIIAVSVVAVLLVAAVATGGWFLLHHFQTDNDDYQSVIDKDDGNDNGDGNDDSDSKGADVTASVEGELDTRTNVTDEIIAEYGINGTYTGGWKDGYPNGLGTMAYEDGSVYEGNWILGVFSGQGTGKWSDGVNSYEFTGAWLDGEPFGNGTGVIRYANGSSYEGALAAVDGMLVYAEGLGTFRWTDGSSWMGSFAEGLMNGAGIYTSDEGVTAAIEYDNGVQVPTEPDIDLAALDVVILETDKPLNIYVYWNETDETIFYRDELGNWTMLGRAGNYKTVDPSFHYDSDGYLVMAFTTTPNAYHFYTNGKGICGPEPMTWEFEITG